MPEGKKEEFIPIGKIVGAHGIHGNVKLLYFSRLKAFPHTEFYLREPNGTFRCYRITHQIPLKGTLALTLEGIASRDEAQSLKGKLVFYPRKDFVHPRQDEYYWIDLIGMTVVEPSSAILGKIKGMMETGGTDVMEIEFEGREILIPFSYEWIEDISIKEKRLILREGTLEFFDVH
jgi:16S rRNA processing protein RimM